MKIERIRHHDTYHQHTGVRRISNKKQQKESDLAVDREKGKDHAQQDNEELKQQLKEEDPEVSSQVVATEGTTPAGGLDIVV